MSQEYVDISRLQAKMAAILKTAPDECKKAVSYAFGQIYLGAIKNLSGPHYGTEPTRTGGQKPGRGPETGKMPIPRITGNLAGSLSYVRPTDFLVIIFSDRKKANYAKYVHGSMEEGSDQSSLKIKPRRFLGDVVRTKRDAIGKEMTRIIKEGIDKVGNP